jgi:hypothetical protein
VESHDFPPAHIHFHCHPGEAVIRLLVWANTTLDFERNLDSSLHSGDDGPIGRLKCSTWNIPKPSKVPGATASPKSYV